MVYKQTMSNSTSVLVTGGSGFIGRHFCEQAVDKGWQVIVLTRDPKQAARRLPVSVRLICDLKQLTTCPPVLVNLAGEPLVSGRWNDQRKQLFYRSRINTTLNLVEQFKAMGAAPRRVISGSAIGYYGHGSDAMDENTHPVDGFSHQLCDAWEQAARQFEQLGSRVCLLRTGIVLGDEGALARMLPAFRMGLGGRLGSGRQWMSWIHIGDMVRLIFHCIKRTDLRLAVNAVAPYPVSNAEFTRLLAKVLKRPTLFPMPAVIARLVFGEMADELLLNGQKVLPMKAIESNFEFEYPELEGALRQLISRSR